MNPILMLGSDVSIGDSTATDGDREGERGTTFDRDELRVVRRGIFLIDTIGAQNR